MTIKRHINRNINKFIQSFLSLAFFTVTGFSTAYCYGWGQAWFHGYPWWHVEVGNCGISRALAYVTGTSLLAFLHYSLIYRLLNHFFSRYELSHNISLRASVFVSVFTLPVLLVFYLATGQIPLDMAVGYLIFTGLFVWLFKKRFTEGTSEWDIRKLFHEEHFWFFNFFIFLYFSMLALYVGYLRAEVRTVYDYILLESRPHYILSTTGEKSYILGEKPSGNRHFVIFNRETQSHYTIYVVDLEKTVEAMPSE